MLESCWQQLPITQMWTEGRSPGSTQNWSTKVKSAFLSTLLPSCPVTLPPAWPQTGARARIQGATGRIEAYKAQFRTIAQVADSRRRPPRFPSQCRCLLASDFQLLWPLYLTCSYVSPLMKGLARPPCLHAKVETSTRPPHRLL